MNINRHNYEEYFILYADNELSSDERRLVDEFVLANPDLKDELDIYRNSILTPDTSLNFENKESLLRYDESIMSYIDDELKADEKAELEKLIDGSPRLQQELGLYRQAKLQPDTEISFGNKSVLYRSTERRVVPMRVVRWAAAAAILFAVSFSAVKYFNKKPNQPEFAETTPVTKSPADNIAVKKGENKNESSIVPDNNIEQPIIDEKKKQDNLASTADKTKKNLPKEIKKQDVKLNDEKNKEAIAKNNQPPSNNLPSPQNNPKISDALTNLPKVENEKYVNEGVSGAMAVTNIKHASLDITNSTAYDDQFDEDENKNKKSRGFFRKVTRFVEKNTGIKTTDDDKLRIAAFTVKLK